MSTKSQDEKVESTWMWRMEKSKTAIFLKILTLVADMTDKCQWTLNPKDGLCIQTPDAATTSLLFVELFPSDFFLEYRCSAHVVVSLQPKKLLTAMRKSGMTSADELLVTGANGQPDIIHLHACNKMGQTLTALKWKLFELETDLRDRPADDYMFVARIPVRAWKSILEKFESIESDKVQMMTHPNNDHEMSLLMQAESDLSTMTSLMVGKTDTACKENGGKEGSDENDIDSTIPTFSMLKPCTQWFSTNYAINLLKRTFLAAPMDTLTCSIDPKMPLSVRYDLVDGGQSHMILYIAPKMNSDDADGAENEEESIVQERITRVMTEFFKSRSQRKVVSSKSEDETKSKEETKKAKRKSNDSKEAKPTPTTKRRKQQKLKENESGTKDSTAKTKESSVDINTLFS